MGSATGTITRITTHVNWQCAGRGFKAVPRKHEASYTSSASQQWAAALKDRLFPSRFEIVSDNLRYRQVSSSSAFVRCL